MRGHPEQLTFQGHCPVRGTWANVSGTSGFGLWGANHHWAFHRTRDIILVMVAPRTWLSLLLVGMSGCACSSHEKAPPLAKCGTDGCNPATGINASLASGGSNSVSDAGGAGNGISLTVSAVAFTDNGSGSSAWTMAYVKGLSDDVAVDVPSVLGTILTLTGPTPLTFSSGVSTGVQAWVSVRPTLTGSVYLPGIVSISNLSSMSVSVPLLQVNDFDFIQGLLTTVPLTLDSTKAQVVVKVVDSQGNGVRNAQIADLGGAAQAYSSSGAWIAMSTTLNPFTDASGRIVAINLPAASTPGGFVTVTASGTNTLGVSVAASALMPVEAGFVTYGTVVLLLS